MRLRNLVYLLLSIHVLHSQSADIAKLTVPDELTKNANAVILLHETDISVESRNYMEVRVNSVIKVLNKKGNRAIRRGADYDKNTRLKDMYVEIFDKNGNQIERIKQKDFKDVTAVDGFTIYTDSRIKYFDFTPLDYPYTVAFSYTYTTPDTAFIPSWSPLSSYNVSVLKSVYQLAYEEGLNLRLKEKNFNDLPIENLSQGNSIHYELKNTSAVKEEMLCPEAFKIAPKVLFALDNFHLEGVDGYGVNWHDMGKWRYENLLMQQDVLPVETITKIGTMLKDVKDPVEKVKMVYEYVQDNTRYVSVQLGIGGWKPISATEVDRTKYGDCKGLTNYTKALLKSQGINSYYSVVWAGDSKRDMEDDFASFQGNHVILNVPIEGKDYWLECTSQDIPFGYLGDFTDDRDVFVVTPDGGIIKHTDAYVNENNLMATVATYGIDASGKLKAKVGMKSHGIIYDYRSSVTGLTEKKKDEFYKENWGNINGLKINGVDLHNDREAIMLVEIVDLEAESYASKIGNDLLFRINPFDANQFVPARYRSRKLPFEIQRGFLDQSQYTVTIPESYTLNEIPSPVQISNKFGTYEMEIQKNEAGELIYKRKLMVRKGSYSRDDYSSYRNFRREVAKNDNLKILLTQKL